MSWGKHHNTAKCSDLYREIIRDVTEQDLDRLFNIRDLALQYASPQGVACAASHIRLPPPHESSPEEKQLSESFHERMFSWESPWLRDLRLVRQWQDEQAYALYNTWFADIDHDDETRHSRRGLSACQHGTELATALDVALEDALHKSADSDCLVSFNNSFPAKLGGILHHLSKGCCVLHEGGTTSEARHDSPRGALFTTRHLIDESHMEQLQKEIRRLAQYLSRMRTVARGRREAQMQNQKRWSNESRRGGRVSLMKSLGLGSPLREVCDSGYQEISVDTWESWRRADTPSRAVLIPQLERELGQQLNCQVSSAPEDNPPKKAWRQNKIRW